MKTLKILGMSALGGVIFLTGCTTPPPTRITQPLTAKPVAPATTYENNGSIYQASTGRLFLFEEARARQIGDTITIVIQENTSAGKSSNSGANRSNSMTNTATITGKGIPFGSDLDNFGLDLSSSSAFSGKGSTNSQYNFKGTITATVTEVLPNGNLVIGAEKQIGINQGEEFVRIVGVVNPRNIRENTVVSTQLADVKLEYRGNGYINEAQIMPWLARFFLNILPF